MNTKSYSYVLHIFGLLLVVSGLTIFFMMGFLLAQSNQTLEALKPQDAGPIAFFSLVATSTGLLGLTWRTHRFDTAVGLFITFILLIFLELGAKLLPETPSSTISHTPILQESERVVYEGGISQQHHDAIGFVYQPDNERKHIYQTENQAGAWQESDVQWTSTDRYGRRTIPITKLENRPYHILFFGGSFTAGYILPDTQSLPTQVGLQTPNHAPYNYGVDGYGTANMLAQLETGQLPSQVPQKEGIALYIFIADHINRTIGHSQVVWREKLPYYQDDGQGNLISHGTFTNQRPFYNLFQGMVMRSDLAKRFNIGIPVQRNDSHYQLITQVLVQAKEEYQTQFGADNRFVVVIYPYYGAPELLPYLDKAGIDYLNYDQLSPYGDELASKYWYSDGHPKAATHEQVASQLVADLEARGWLRPLAQNN